MSEESSLPPIPPEQMPKPEVDIPVRNTPYLVQELDVLVMDGRCPPDWPLSHLWPVFMGNFRCSAAHQYGKAVRQFFASKGLLVRWHFQLLDDYFYQFQLKANLYDGLVYFGCEQDANYALECDHSLYNGYTLNVFPGREPIYFPADRSAIFRNMKSGIVYSEEFFARAMMRRHGGVRCVVKYDIKTGAAEFYTPAQKDKMFAGERQFHPLPVGHQTLQKQRFVEANVQQQIQNELRKDPSALHINTHDSIFRSLQTGNLPQPLKCPGPPPRRGGGGSGGIQPVRNGPTKQQMRTKLNNKLKKMRRIIERDLAQGKEPKKFAYTKADKRRYREIYNQVKREGNW